MHDRLMPPKSTKSNIRQDFIHSVCKDGTTYHDYISAGPSQLTADQLSRAYGLSSSVQEDVPETSHLLRQCKCKWTRDALQGKAAGIDTIVLDSDGEGDELDAQLVQSEKKATTGSKATKAKGKWKAVCTTSSDCSPSACHNNPKCLNHLGQDKWESCKPS